MVDCSQFWPALVALGLLFVALCHFPFGIDRSHTVCSIIAAILFGLAFIVSLVC